mmetsp:Transcript_11831/g.23920  ORF Transcript_11831/g.23920 Transcript_11831/m.23920 type:complete len:259 (+) Transcript_11831:530-1306(+)
MRLWLTLCACASSALNSSFASMVKRSEACRCESSFSRKASLRFEASLARLASLRSAAVAELPSPVLLLLLSLLLLATRFALLSSPSSSGSVSPSSARFKRASFQRSPGETTEDDDNDDVELSPAGWWEGGWADPQEAEAQATVAGFDLTKRSVDEAWYSVGVSVVTLALLFCLSLRLGKDTASLSAQIVSPLAKLARDMDRVSRFDLSDDLPAAADTAAVAAAALTPLQSPFSSWSKEPVGGGGGGGGRSERLRRRGS